MNKKDKQSKLSLGNSTRIEGFVDLKLVRNGGKTVIHQHNTITNAGKQLLLDKGAASALCMSPSVYGQLYTLDPITHLGINGREYNSIRSAQSVRDLTNVLLNLEDNTGLSSNTTFVNTNDSSFSPNNNVIIGYANNNINPPSNNKEGSIDYTPAEYLVDGYSIAKRWVYPAGVGSGTINTIAMMPKSVISTPYGYGIRSIKCLDRVNKQNTNFVSFTNGILPPGVPNYTSANEILLNFNQDGSDKHKYNISTGEMTNLTDSDPFFTPTGNGYVITDYYVEGNYLYYVVPEGRYQYVYVYDISVTPTPTLVTSFTTNVNGQVYFTKFLKFNDKLYLSSAYYTYPTETNQGSYKLLELNKGSEQYYNSYGAGYNDFKQIGLNIPDSINISRIAIGNFGSVYAVYISNDTAYVSDSEPSQNNYTFNAYIFSDLTNIDPSRATDCIPMLSIKSILFNTSSSYGVVQIGIYGNSNTNNSYEYVCSEPTAILNICNNTNSSLTINELTNQGCFISTAGWWSNCMSFVKLEQPIEKSDTDVLYVTYGYKVV